MLRVFGFFWLVILTALIAIRVVPVHQQNTDLQNQVTHLSAEITRLHQEQSMPSVVLRQHRSAICYIYSVYSFQVPGSSKVDHRTRVSGTGFVVAPGLMATNRHVVQPWYEDPDDEARIAAGEKPHVERIVAFFPTLAESIPLYDVQVSPDQDLAVARFSSTTATREIEPLKLASAKPNPGDPVVVVGYPLGVSAMLAKSPRNVFSRLALKKDAIDIATDLAEHDLIRPSSTCGHVSDIVNEKVIYDAPTAQGGSGGPVFDAEGDVIAVNAAYIDGFSGGTIGITTASLRPLVEIALRR